MARTKKKTATKKAATEPTLIDKIAAQMSAADDASDMISLAGAHGLEVTSTGGAKVWVNPEPGTTLAGRVIGFDDREISNRGTGEVKTRRDYMLQLQSIAPEDRVLVRGDHDPERDKGRKIVSVTNDGETRKFALAEVGDVVFLSESYRLRVLADHVGDTVFIKFMGKKAIGGGKKVWEVAVQFLPRSSPGAIAGPANVRLIDSGDK